jgi:hypothetical protein
MTSSQLHNVKKRQTRLAHPLQKIIGKLINFNKLNFLKTPLYSEKSAKEKARLRFFSAV